MKDNLLSSNIFDWGTNFNDYIMSLKQNPWLIVSLVIDLLIVGFILYKIIKGNKGPNSGYTHRTKEEICI